MLSSRMSLTMNTDLPQELVIAIAVGDVDPSTNLPFEVRTWSNHSHYHLTKGWLQKTPLTDRPVEGCGNSLPVPENVSEQQSEVHLAVDVTNTRTVIWLIVVGSIGSVVEKFLYVPFGTEIHILYFSPHFPTLQEAFTAAEPALPNDRNTSHQFVAKKPVEMTAQKNVLTNYFCIPHLMLLFQGDGWVFIRLWRITVSLLSVDAYA